MGKLIFFSWSATQWPGFPREGETFYNILGMTIRGWSRKDLGREGWWGGSIIPLRSLEIACEHFAFASSINQHMSKACSTHQSWLFFIIMVRLGKHLPFFLFNKHQIFCISLSDSLCIACFYVCYSSCLVLRKNITWNMVVNFSATQKLSLTKVYFVATCSEL